jgi:hypothetical protein
MATENIHMALFEEDKIDHAAEAVERLHQLGIRDKDIAVISGVPYSDKILGRPMAWTRVPQIGGAGAVLGFLAAMTLNFIPNIQYPLMVGGKPYIPIPTSIVVTFEITMLGLLISTFIGVLIEMFSPSFGPRGYNPKISDGSIAVLFTCPEKLEEKMQEQMKELEAELKHGSEIETL